MTQIIGLPADVTTVDAPGFYMVPHSVYHGPKFTPDIPISQSAVKTILERSPAHFIAGAPADDAEGEHEMTKQQALGTAIHSLLLSRGADIVEVPYDSFRSKDAKEIRDTAIANRMCPLLTKDLDTAREIAGRVGYAMKKIPGCWDAFNPERGAAEVAMVWQEGQFWLKSQIDFLGNDRVIFDVKTTSASAAPGALPRMMVDQGFDIQGAMYVRGMAALDPESRGRVKVRFVVVEVQKPYALSVMELDQTALTLGAKRLEMGVALMKRCIQSKTWPGYPDLIHKPEYPGWAENQFLAREITEPDMHKASNYQKLADNWQAPV